jgi:hypothetical protein
VTPGRFESTLSSAKRASMSMQAIGGGSVELQADVFQ